MKANGSKSGLLVATTLMMLALVASTTPAAALMNPEPPCLPVTDAISPPVPINSEVDTGKVHDALATINGGDDGSDPTDVHCQRGFPPAGKGGGGGSDLVSCYTQGLIAGQSTEQDLNAKLPDAVSHAEQIHSASQATAASVTDLCLADDGGGDGETSCTGYHDKGYAMIVCSHGCGFYPQPTGYSVGTTGADPGEEPPLVYGAVWCGPGYTPAPPLGVSCAGNGHCDGQAEGVKVLSGYCVHTVFGNQPEVIGRTCKW
jgi:hypothetical protein